MKHYLFIIFNAVMTSSGVSYVIMNDLVPSIMTNKSVYVFFLLGLVNNNNFPNCMTKHINYYTLLLFEHH